MKLMIYKTDVVEVDGRKVNQARLLETLDAAGATPRDRKRDAQERLARKGYTVRALNEGPQGLVAYVTDPPVPAEAAEVPAPGKAILRAGPQGGPLGAAVVRRVRSVRERAEAGKAGKAAARRRP